MKTCKHKFEPRYSEEPNQYMDIDKLRKLDFPFATDSGFRDMFIVRKYKLDICVKCGQIRKDSIFP